MNNSKTPKIWLTLQRWISPGVVLVYQIIALIALGIVPVLASQWMDNPFIGAFVEHTLIVNDSPPSRSGTWETYNIGLKFGNQILSIDEIPIKNVRQLTEVLETRQVGEQIALTVLTPVGGTRTFEITLQNFPVADQIVYFFAPYFIGLTYLGISIWVFMLRRRDATGRVFAVFTTSVALSIATLFDSYTTNQLLYLWVLAPALAGGALLNLAMLFPRDERILASYPIVRWFSYPISLGLILFAFPTLYNLTRPLDYVFAWRLEYIFAGISLFIFIILTGIRWLTSPSPVVREQARLILGGSMLAFAPLALWFFLTVIWPERFHFYPILLLLTVFFPIATAYTILRYRLLQTDYLLSRAFLYTLLIALAVSSYALLVSGLTLITGKSFLVDYPYLIGVMLFVFALLFTPLRLRLEKIVNSVFSRGQAAYRGYLQAFGRELTQAMELSSIIQLLRHYVNENLMPAQLHVFTHDTLSDHYIASPDGEIGAGKPTSDLRFSTNSALVQSLTKQHTPIFLAESSNIPAMLRPEQARIALLGSQIFVPLPGRQQLTGWIALGPRRSGEPYSSHDIEFLASLCDQAALAVERAQVVVDLERRVHEMNVLTRVSQGINVTLVFDDILELIYAQTNQVIPARDFRVTLHDEFSEILYHVFYLDNDERLSEQENKPIPIGQGLEREVLKSRRPIVTDDYERECRRRGVLPFTQGAFAWAGVPLNTGAETIGVISLSSRDSSLVYTEEQVNLLQAIADQAAGAIVKAQLLDEAERRTKQLTKLNEVARSMSSTLELEPLLNQILNSAVEILNCEAGSLLLVDEETGELVFEVVVGPVAQDLLGKRLPYGTGLVGKAVDTRQAIIVNDVRSTKDWFDKSDEQTGFSTNDLLVVPMQVKDRVTGVIEVLNRRDGLPFTPDDQELLTAYTSQAAVALDNARLYTLTDQTLAARVEELSVMQRIDRELNTSLDVERAMRITLEWAMRQSRANAGLVGVKEEERIRIIASQGYTTELSAYSDSYLPADLPAINTAIQSGQPQILLMTGSDETADEINILTGARAQTLIPIRREEEVIGIVLLESRSPDTIPDETMAFLSRLSDHAAIAISNAQLYSEIQAANLAKSDFVSFVSHELKTPMTSIKGFTDLLATGVVGSVNEAQSNFLSTIRSNVDRMATLVSDLADVSRIEAGRLRLDFESVPLDDIVSEVVRSAQSMIEDKEQTLTLELPPDLPPMWGDRTRIIQVLTNLVSNAYKYTPQGGQITIYAEFADNHWDPEGAPKVVHVSVKDTGFGISHENQQKIFQKFFRSDDQKVRDIAGTGLGLNITKTLVEMQGGRIWFESEAEKGTTFHFTIPIVETT